MAEITARADGNLAGAIRAMLRDGVGWRELYPLKATGPGDLVTGRDYGTAKRDPITLTLDAGLERYVTSLRAQGVDTGTDHGFTLAVRMLLTDAVRLSGRKPRTVDRARKAAERVLG